MAGCSPLAIPRARTLPTGDVVCDASYAPPVVDAAIATAAAAVAVWGVTEPDTGETDGHTMTLREAALVPGVLGVIAFGFAAGYGFSKVARCRSDARK